MSQLYQSSKSLTILMIITTFTLITNVLCDTCQWGVGNFNNDGKWRPYAVDNCNIISDTESTILTCNNVDKTMAPITYEYTGTTECEYNPLVESDSDITENNAGQFGGSCRTRGNNCKLYKLTSNEYEKNNCRGKLINTEISYITSGINNDKCNGISSNGDGINEDIYMRYRIAEYTYDNDNGEISIGIEYESFNYGNRKNKCRLEEDEYVIDYDYITNGCNGKIDYKWEILGDDYTPSPSDEPTEEPWELGAN